MTEPNKKLPIIQVRDRTLSVSIFERVTNDLTTGKTIRTYGACAQRSFKKKDSEQWEREQINMFPEDLLKMANVFMRAYNRLVDHVNSIKSDNAAHGDFPSSPMSDSDIPEPPAYLNDDIPF